MCSEEAEYAPSKHSTTCTKNKKREHDKMRIKNTEIEKKDKHLKDYFIIHSLCHNFAFLVHVVISLKHAVM